MYRNGNWLAETVGAQDGSVFSEQTNRLCIVTQEQVDAHVRVDVEDAGYRGRIVQVLVSNRAGQFRVVCECKRWTEVEEQGRSRTIAWRPTVEEARDLWEDHCASHVAAPADADENQAEPEPVEDDEEPLPYHQPGCDGETKWLYVAAEGVARMLRDYLTCDCGGVKLGNFHRNAPAMSTGTICNPKGIREACTAGADALADRNSYDRVGPFVVLDEVSKRAPVEWRHAQRTVPVVIDPNSAAQQRSLARDAADAAAREQWEDEGGAVPGVLVPRPVHEPMPADPVRLAQLEKQARVQMAYQTTQEARRAAWRMAGERIQEQRRRSRQPDPTPPAVSDGESIAPMNPGWAQEWWLFTDVHGFGYEVQHRSSRWHGMARLEERKTPLGVSIPGRLKPVIKGGCATAEGLLELCREQGRQRAKKHAGTRMLARLAGQAVAGSAPQEIRLVGTTQEQENTVKEDMVREPVKNTFGSRLRQAGPARQKLAGARKKAVRYVRETLPPAAARARATGQQVAKTIRARLQKPAPAAVSHRPPVDLNEQQSTAVQPTVPVPVEAAPCAAHIARDGSEVDATTTLSLGERAWGLCPEHTDRFGALLDAQSQTLTLGGREWAVSSEHAEEFSALLVGALGEPGEAVADTAEIPDEDAAGHPVEESVEEYQDDEEQAEDETTVEAQEQDGQERPSVMLSGEVPGYDWDEAREALRNAGFDIAGRAKDSTVLILCGVGAEKNATKLRDARERGIPCMDVTEPGRFKDAVCSGEFVGGDPLPEPVKAVHSGLTEREKTDCIRKWGRENGFELKDRGRLPQHVRVAYEEAREQQLQAA